MKFDNHGDWHVWIGGKDLHRVKSVDIGEKETTIVVDGHLPHIREAWDKIPTTSQYGSSTRSAAFFSGGDLATIREVIRKALGLEGRNTELEAECARLNLVIDALRCGGGELE